MVVAVVVSLCVLVYRLFKIEEELNATRNDYAGALILLFCPIKTLFKMYAFIMKHLKWKERKAKTYA